MLRLYNSLGKRIQKFQPANPKMVNIFTCGPSVYQRAHIGNFRTFLFEDVLVRYLRFSGFKVKRGLNFTDIEDKAVEEAEKEQLTTGDLTQKNIQAFLDEMHLLRMLRPDYLPRASRSVGEAARLIESLLETGTAYRHGANIYFDPLKFPGFGKIYGLDMSTWPKIKRRFSRDTYPGMRWNKGDFILWHGRSEGERDSWNTPIGLGRPAWNIQDASMVNHYFHETLSIYCGGIDNLVRHHDYTRAILESVRPYPTAKFWLHSEHLLVKGAKMSKSKGNVYYTDTLLQQGYSPEEIRFFLICGHYRQRVNYSDQLMRRRAEELSRLRHLAREIAFLACGTANTHCKSALRLRKAFTSPMDDDLHVKEACEGVVNVLSQIKPEILEKSEVAGILKVLQEIDRVLEVIF